MTPVSIEDEEDIFFDKAHTISSSSEQNRVMCKMAEDGKKHLTFCVLHVIFSMIDNNNDRNPRLVDEERLDQAEAF